MEMNGGTMIKIHAIETGRVQVRRAQMAGRGHGIARMANMLLDEQWSDWLPIYAWAIEQGDRIVLVDTGETARVHEHGYHPRWHPFYRRGTRFRVTPEDELGPRLRELGISPRDISHVVLTHLHTDHAGGLRHVVGCKTLVHGGELKRAQGMKGRLNGYLTHRWPKW
jgi:N-acyl homoserine lactone hydrolase